MVQRKHGPTRDRWERAIKNETLDLIHHCVIVETQAEQLWQTLKAGTVSTNVHFRELHNSCLAMNWLPWPIIPQRQWPKIVYGVSRALQERRALKFHYRKPGEKSANLRQVHPYHLTCSDNRWYILAHDPERAEVRTFALGRIKTAVLTKHRFIKAGLFDPQKYLGDSFSVMKGDGDCEVVIEFDAWPTDLLRGPQCHRGRFTLLRCYFARITFEFLHGRTDYVVDHIVPLERGGDYILTTACLAGRTPSRGMLEFPPRKSPSSGH